MSRFEGVRCDGPNCASSEPLHPDWDVIPNWLALMEVQAADGNGKAKVQEYHFCSYTCLARFANRREQNQPKPKVILGSPQKT